MNYSLYIHIAPNNKKYIGITSRNPIDRWNKGNGYRNNSHFYSAIKKYGWENIEHIILETNLTKEEAEKLEIEMIKIYHTTNRKYGYNNSNGGKTIGTHSLKSRRKMSLSHMGKRCRGVKVICIETNVVFDTYVDAGNYYNVCDKHIGKCCSGERKTAGGYHWKKYEVIDK